MSVLTSDTLIQYFCHIKLDDHSWKIVYNELLYVDNLINYITLI